MDVSGEENQHMKTNEYFDTNVLTTPTPSKVSACPVRGCNAELQTPSNGKRLPLYCPDHGIKIHTKTFKYNNPLRNIRFEPDYFRQRILGNPFKAETYHLKSENSEDALTWNVFTSLAKAGRLAALASSLAQVDVNKEPELYLWGLRINPDDPANTVPFAELSAARDTFERGINRMHTEPDIMLYVPGKLLMLIEAKFMSGNTIAVEGKKDVLGEKPKSPAGIMKRYSVGDLPLGSMSTDHLTPPFFSQLYRNLVFAIWMADRLNVEWRLVNLVSDKHHRDSLDPTPFIHSLLPVETRHRFARYSWERLFRDHIEGKGHLSELANYLRYKSANREKGLDI